MSSVGPVKVSLCEFGGTSQGVVVSFGGTSQSVVV